MSAQAWLAFTLGVISVIGSFAAGIKWLVKAYLSELKPDGNGGHNIEGRLARLEASQERIETRIDQIYLSL